MRGFTVSTALLVLLTVSALAEETAAPERTATEVESNESTAQPAATGSVHRALFTTAVSDREPADQVSELSNEARQIAFFTELLGFEGQTLAHVWERDGEVMAEVTFTVGGPRWRAYSTKNLEPSWIGAWTVKVVDEAGTVHATEQLSYIEWTRPAGPADSPATPASPSRE